MLRYVSIAAFLLLLTSSSLYAQIFTVESGRMSFTGSVPLHDFTGESDSLRGSINLDEKQFRFSLPLKTLDTGIDRRDRKMYDILNTDEYPEVVFEGEFGQLPDITAADSQEVSVAGLLSLNGRTKSETVTGRIIRTDNGIRVEATWSFDYTEYGIDRPGFLFYKVDEEIEIRISALLTRQMSM